MHRKTGLNSFTLVEMLVSIAVLSILVVLLLSMLGNLLSAWQLGQAHNERRNIAQVVVDRVTRDLRFAALPAAQGNTSSLGFVMNPSGVSLNYASSLFWQAPVATDGGTKGNLAIVGYFVQWVNGNPGTPVLCRLLINPSSPDYAVYSGGSGWVSDALLNSYSPATFISTTAANNYQGLLAENVLGIWAQALDPQGYPVQQTGHLGGEYFDSRLPYVYTGYTQGNPQSTTNLPSCLPASVQVAFAIMDSRTAARIATLGRPTYPTLTGNFWSDVQAFYNGLPKSIQRGTEIQTITVPLEGGPK